LRGKRPWYRTRAKLLQVENKLNGTTKYQGKILNRETNNQNKGIPKQRRKYREGYNLGNRLNTQPNAQSKNTKKEGNAGRLASFAETAVVIPNING
jgi:hypothetical protein